MVIRRIFIAEKTYSSPVHKRIVRKVVMVPIVFWSFVLSFVSYHSTTAPYAIKEPIKCPAIYQKPVSEENKIQVVDTGLQVCFRLPKQRVYHLKVGWIYSRAYKRHMVKVCEEMEENYTYS